MACASFSYILLDDVERTMAAWRLSYADRAMLIIAATADLFLLAASDWRVGSFVYGATLGVQLDLARRTIVQPAAALMNQPWTPAELDIRAAGLAKRLTDDSFNAHRPRKLLMFPDRTLGAVFADNCIADIYRNCAPTFVAGDIRPPFDAKHIRRVAAEHADANGWMARVVRR